MSDPTENPNPYRPPVAVVAELFAPASGSMRFAPPAARVSAGHGAAWIGDGWTLFKAEPLMWIAAMLIIFGVSFLVSVVPVLGQIANMLIGPVFAVGIMEFARTQAQEGKSDLGKLFTGFSSDKLGSLLMVALLYVALMILAVIVTVIVFVVLAGGAGIFGALASGNAEKAMGAMLAGGGLLFFILAMLIFLLFMFVVVGAYWFAPGLVFYTGLGPVEAMKESFSATLKNWLPFTVYGLAGLGIILLGILSLGLGLIVAMPVFMASYYACFADLYGRETE